MDIRNYITKRKRDKNSKSETESDNLSAVGLMLLNTLLFIKFVHNIFLILIHFLFKI